MGFGNHMDVLDNRKEEETNWDVSSSYHYFLKTILLRSQCPALSHKAKTLTCKET